MEHLGEESHLLGRIISSKDFQLVHFLCEEPLVIEVVSVGQLKIGYIK